MQIVIDIPEKEYTEGRLDRFFGCYSDKLDKVIYNGTPLPTVHGGLYDYDVLSSLVDEDFSKFMSRLDIKLPRPIIKANRSV